MLNSKINPDDLNEYEVEVPFTGSLFFTILAKSKTDANNKAREVLKEQNAKDLSPEHNEVLIDEMIIRKAYN